MIHNNNLFVGVRVGNSKGYQALKNMFERVIFKIFDDKIYVFLDECCEPPIPDKSRSLRAKSVQKRFQTELKQVLFPFVTYLSRYFFFFSKEKKEADKKKKYCKKGEL